MILEEEKLNKYKNKKYIYNDAEAICICGDSYDVIKDIQDKSIDLIFCFDDKTELLTKDGWKNIKDIKINDYLLSREPNTRKLEYVKNIKEIKIDYDGNMYSYEGKNISIFVSENHKLFINNKKWYYDKNDNNKLKNMQYDDFIEAKEAYNKTFNFISAGGIWEGTKDKIIKINNIGYDKVKFARLLGIFLTDGYVNKKTNLISISQTKKNICKVIENLLNDLNIKYSIYKNREANIYNFYKPKTTFGDYFNQFSLKENRHIPQEFKDSNIEVLKSLLDGILDGDSDKERRRIYISSNSLRDDIMEICYKIGKSANYIIKKPRTKFLKSENRYIIGKKEYYCISINNRHYLSHIHKNEKSIKYKGKLYCCCLEKWHTVLMRRNGKCIWIRQCDPPYFLNKQGGTGSSKISKNITRFIKDGLKQINQGWDYSLIDEWYRVCKKVNFSIWCNQNQLKDYFNMFDNNDYSIWLQMWEKTNPIPSVNNTLINDIEYLFYVKESGVYYNNDLKCNEKKHFFSSPITNSSQNRFHPSEKKYEVLMYFLKQRAKRNDWLLDTFAGSFSIVPVALELGVNCICIEKEEEYYNKSIERLDNMYNNKLL